MSEEERKLLLCGAAAQETLSNISKEVASKQPMHLARHEVLVAALERFVHDAEEVANGPAR